MMLKLIIPCCLFLLFSFLGYSEANFFVSTTTSSTTLSTVYICYDQSAAATYLIACSKKKKRKRQLSIEANPEQTSAVDLAPSKVEAISEPQAEAVADSKSEDDVDELSALEGSERDRRQFLNYWLTITKTTTLTSYTTTSSLSAIYCTPYDFLYNPCAGDGSGPGKKKRKKRSGADMD